jgi:Eukaryotic aspartyl protease/Adenovirus E3 region protein CR2
VQVGTPPQISRVLISSSSSSLWVPVPDGCLNIEDPKCPDLRGGLFNYNDSSTWKADNYYELPLQPETHLRGYSGNSLVGFDNVTLGWMGSGGPYFNNTVITGFATKDFYLGELGLTARPVNISDFNHQYASPLTALFKAGTIPSLTWSYTAGAPYRRNKAYASLTLGGYDAARSDQTRNITVPMGVDSTRELLVAINNVSSDATTFLDEGIYAFINSAVSMIWLPVDACAKFEQAFGLIYDTQTDLYVVNDTQHEKLLKVNPNITFSVSAKLPADDPANSTSIDITFPYGAFDRIGWYPVASVHDNNQTVHYFPLRRADNSSQYTLGRAFLQETYLHVDYHRSRFTIAQTQFPSDPADSGKIIAVYPDTPARNATDEANQPGKPKSSNSKHMVGIVVGVLIGVAILIAALLAYIFYRRRRRRQEAPSTIASQSSSDVQNGGAGEAGEAGEIRRVNESYLVEPKAELPSGAVDTRGGKVISKQFLDGEEIAITRLYMEPESAGSTTAPPRAPGVNPGRGRPLSARELAGTPRAELDARKSDIFELSAENEKKLP